MRQLARSLQTTLWPGEDLYHVWADELFEAHVTPLTDAVTEAHQALQALSGLAVLTTQREALSEHQIHREQETTRYAEALQIITDIQPADAVIVEIVGYLTALAERIQMEFDPPAELQLQESLAAGIALGATGTATEDFAALDGLITLSLQWDLHPVAAVRLLEDS